MRIGSVVSYCENEHAFLAPCIEKLKQVSDIIVVSYCEKTFDGEEQDLSKLEEFKMKTPGVNFAEFSFEDIFKKDPRKGHNLCRIIGHEILKENVDKIMFLDTDEIIDVKNFKSWRESTNEFETYDHLNLQCHWYYRDVCFQAIQKENCVSIHSMDVLTSQMLDSPAERWFWYNAKNTKIGAMTRDGQPLAHHYSWVRTKDQLLKKVKSWGHAQDKGGNWSAKIEACFQSDFDGNPRACLGGRTDIVHNYSYKKVSPYIQL